LSHAASQLQYEDNRKALLANISHDLKTPITAISNCIEGLKDGIADTPEKQHKYYDMIQKKAFDMNRLIEELFLFSKLDLRKMPFHIEPVELSSYINEFVEELRHDPHLQDIRMAVKNEGNKPLFVMADREKLRRVLSNIVDNSVKHMDKKDKTIEIELMDGSDEVTVKIRDNGSGIDAASLPRIFERFYREDRSRNADTGGSGLGLAIVEQIIAEHGGRVWAESVASEGLSLYFTLTKPEGLGAKAT
jgi:signal transduction histidine kinase